MITIAQSNKSKFYTRLKNLVTLYVQKVNDKVREQLSKLPVLDKAPTDNLPLMENVIQEYFNGKYEGQDSIIVSGRIGELMTDPKYNRGDALRYGNQERDLNSMGGFSYSSAGVLAAYLRPNGTVVLTQGNNRTSMLFAVTQNENARISLTLNFHKNGASEEEMTRVEAENHNADCAFRTTQDSDDKFKSAFHSKQPWAVSIFNFLKPYSIGIAGTLENATFNCTSHSYVDNARKEAGEQYVKNFLDIHTKVFSAENCEKDIYGNFVRGGSIFLSVFSSYIDEVNEKNDGMDSFQDMMRHYFADREKGALQIRKMVEDQGMPQSTLRQVLAQVPVVECLTQGDVTQGNRIIKGATLFVCRFVSLYNEYCKQNNLNYNKTQSSAIPVTDGKTFANFVKKVDPILRQSFIEVSKLPVVSKTD
jgi:hypothetical protein